MTRWRQARTPRRIKGERSIRIEDFFLLPGSTPQRETVLEPGDLISCGTPDSPEHQQRVQAGDTMIAEIEGIGKMKLGIRAA